LNPKLPPDQLLSQGIEANARWTMKQIRSSPEGKARVAEGRVKLVGAIWARAVPAMTNGIQKPRRITTYAQWSMKEWC